jgi:hypothetical protein
MWFDYSYIHMNIHSFVNLIKRHPLEPPIPEGMWDKKSHTEVTPPITGASVCP